VGDRSGKRKKKKKKGGSPHPDFEPVIGLEVHVQLSTKSKMFCRCENRFGAPPNSLVCPVCLGHPGTLPYINRAAVESAIRAGLACGCRIAEFTKFDRKNYYYPDLPKNYQISQYDLPIASGGHVVFDVEGERRSVRLVRIHLEEDAGKNIHTAGAPESQVDLNRAGVPLLEIVTEPDIHSPREAGAFLKMLRLILLYLGISDCNMEEGSLRCDSNVSIRPRGSDRLETRTELKNINSFTFVVSGLEHEIARQIVVREAGGSVVQETRLYDPDRDETRSMRGKEEAHDYRYFPEPDLAPIKIGADWLEKLRKTIPPLPLERLERLVQDHGLPFYDAEILLQDPAVLNYAEDCFRLYSNPKAISNWMINALFNLLNQRKVGLGELGLPPARFVELVRAVDGGKVSKQGGNDLLARMTGNDRPLKDLIEEMGIGQISDDSFIRGETEIVLKEHGSVVEDLRQGKKQALNFLVGQVMRRTRGKANPGRVSEVIREIVGF